MARRCRCVAGRETFTFLFVAFGSCISGQVLKCGGAAEVDVGELIVAQQDRSLFRKRGWGSDQTKAVSGEATTHLNRARTTVLVNKMCNLLSKSKAKMIYHRVLKPGEANTYMCRMRSPELRGIGQGALSVTTQLGIGRSTIPTARHYRASRRGECRPATSIVSASSPIGV